MENYHKVKLHATARIAPTASLLGDVEVSEEATIMHHAALRGEHGGIVRVGAHTNIQEGCCLHQNYDGACIVGEGVTVGHSAILHGCTVGDNTLVGMGAILLDDSVVGNNCIVGAGAVVTGGTHIPDNTMVVGVPAKPVRTLTDEEIEHNRRAAQRYFNDGTDLVAGGFLYTGDTIPTNLMTIALSDKTTAGEPK